MISCSEYKDIKISVTEVRKNQTYSCKNCSYSFSCPLKKYIYNDTLTVTEICITFCNKTSEVVKINTGVWELVDTEGFTYGAASFCDNLMPLRTVNPNDWRLEPGSKVKFWLIFPFLDNNVDIAALIYCDLAPEYMILELGPISSEIQELFEAKKRSVSEDKISTDYELQGYLQRLKKLKTQVFSRTHNILTARERTTLDNIITTEIFSISQFLKDAKDYQLKSITPEFSEVIEEYENNKKREEAELNSKFSLSKTIPELLELTPREFEQWTAKLLEHLNYTNVVLTPQSGDKGIDVFAERDGKKIGVQCKKFKGSVTSPLIQSFLGALQTAEISSGIFITTGTFSAGAKKIAEESNITLIDVERIKGLIKSFPDELKIR